MKNRQEIFDTIVLGLLEQNAKAEDATGECMYQTKTGRKCAAGQLIPDNMYDPRMERNNFKALYNGTSKDYSEEILVEMPFPEIETLCAPEDVDLIADLQGIHDNVPITFWVSEFKQAAERYGLHSSVIDDFWPSMFDD